MEVEIGTRAQATDLFARQQRQALWRRLWRVLTGRRAKVYCLIDQGSGALRLGGRARLETVSIALIRGSEGRCSGFDADFGPLHGHDRRRWVELCAAWLSGAVLPPVELIQVGDIYYVRDGHHRVSVARALGQEQIEAEVLLLE